MQIQNFEEMITPVLKKSQRYVSHECEKLLASGENYGSVMLNVKVKVLNNETEETIIYYVGKTCPPPGIMWEIFNTKVTFKKEIAVYSSIVPILNRFGKEKGVNSLLDCIPKHIAARISLNPESDEVDTDCLLLLPNIKVEGYDVADRFTGFDLETSKLLLHDLAIFHAAPIAFRLENSEEYEEKFRPYLNIDFGFPEHGPDLQNAFIEKFQNAAKSNPKCTPYLSKIEEQMRNSRHNVDNPLEVNELYGTIVHNDYWVNNSMVKFIRGKPIRNRIIDFQVISYDSLAQDVVFFLYSSVELSVLEKHADELMKFYYDQFIDTLKKLKANTSKYTYSNMLKEFAKSAKYSQFTHLLFMLLPMMTLRGKAKDLSELNPEDMLSKDEDLHENFSKRLQFVLHDFGVRRWI